MELTHLIIHEIEKESKKKNPINYAPTLIFEAKKELPFDSVASKNLAENLRKKYSESISGYGNIDQSENSTFHSQLQQFRRSEMDFVQLTQLLARRLETGLSKGKALELGTGGLIVCLEYIEANKTYLLITMIKEKGAITFNRDDFDLEEFLSVDMQNLHEGARIDLEKWESNSQPFISFIKKDKVTDYFRSAINCIDYTDSAIYTQNTRLAIKDYIESKEDWPDEKKEKISQVFNDYINQAIVKKSDDGNPIVKIKELSAIIDPENANDFYEFVREHEYEISDEFQPHNATVSRWTRARVRVGTINLTFDVSDYDEGKIELTDNGDILIRDGADIFRKQLPK